jgi:hypothetical protein
MVVPKRTVEPTVVNGINVDDLSALIEHVKQEPAKRRRKWHVIPIGQGQMPRRGEIESFEIGGERVPRRFSIDRRPPRTRRIGQFVNLQKHLIAALNASMTVGYVGRCAVRGNPSRKHRKTRINQ